MHFFVFKTDFNYVQNFINKKKTIFNNRCCIEKITSKWETVGFENSIQEFFPIEKTLQERKYCDR